MSNLNSTTLLKCPTCTERVVVQRPSLEIVILQRAILVKGGQVHAVCSRCKTEVPIPALEYESRSVFVSETSETETGNKP